MSEEIKRGSVIIFPSKTAWKGKIVVVARIGDEGRLFLEELPLGENPKRFVILQKEVPQGSVILYEGSTLEFKGIKMRVDFVFLTTMRVYLKPSEDETLPNRIVPLEDIHPQ